MNEVQSTDRRPEACVQLIDGRAYWLVRRREMGQTHQDGRPRRGAGSG